MYSLSIIQDQKLEDLNKILESKDATKKKMNKAFHNVIIKIFYWQESRKLLNEMTCLVQ